MTIDSAVTLTKQGIARHQAGDTPDATRLLVQAVQADPRYEMAWLWLASCLNAPGEKRYCLDQALIANPQSAPAQKGLAQLGSVQWIMPSALEQVAPPPELMGAVKPAKKDLPGIVIFLIVIVVVGLAWFGNNLLNPRASSPAAPVNSGGAAYHVTYRLTGSARTADLTIQNASGGTEQKTVRLPWSLNFDGRDAQFLYISAQNTGATGTLKCEILLNSTVVQTADADGAYKIASCSGKI